MAAFIHYGKQVFSFYVPQAEGSFGVGKSVKENYKHQNLNEKFILAWDPPSEMCRKERKLYIVFKNAREAFEWIQKLPAHQRGFYEYALGDRPQKPHFDIDCEINEVDVDYHRPRFEDYFNSVLNSVWCTLNECGININVAEQFRVYDSSGPKPDGMYKLSRHLVVTGVQHNNNIEAGRFYGMVREHLIKTVDIILVDHLYKLDRAVYTSAQQFRLLGSAKEGSKRPKRLLPTVYNIPIAYSAEIKVVGEGYETNDYADYIDSLLNPIGIAADFTSICHPNLLTKETNRFDRDNSSWNMAEDPIAAAERLIEERGLTGYTVDKYNESDRSVRLNNKGGCCLIHNRVHASNGAKIFFYEDGTARFWCFSKNKDAGSNRSVMFGKVEVETEDTPEVEEEPVAFEDLPQLSQELIELAEARQATLERTKFFTIARTMRHQCKALYRPNFEENRSKDVIMDAPEGCYTAYLKYRGYRNPPNISDVIHKFKAFGKIEIQPCDRPYDGAAFDFVLRAYQICEYLTVNHKIRDGVLHMLTSKGWAPREVAGRVKMNYTYKLPGEKSEEITFTFSIGEMMAGSHLTDPRIAGKFPDQTAAFYQKLLTYLDASRPKNVIPFLIGERIPLRSFDDINEFKGYGIYKTLEIAERFNNSFEAIRQVPCVKRVIDHIFMGFANFSVISTYEILSWMSFVFHCPWSMTCKMLNIFGARDCLKSLIICALMQSIFGNRWGSAKLGTVSGRFNAPFLDKAYVVIDEPTSEEKQKASTSTTVLENLKDIITGKFITGEKKGIDAVDYENNVNVAFLSNFPESCSWVEKSDKNRKRSLSYMSNIVGYDSGINQIVVSQTADFAVRMNSSGQVITNSTQAPSVLLNNYISSAGGMYELISAPETVEMFATALYLFATQPGTGFIDTRRNYVQPTAPIHAILGSGVTSSGKQFIERLVSDQGYFWNGKVPDNPKKLDHLIHPYPITNKKNKFRGFTFFKIEVLYEEYVIWHCKCNPDRKGLLNMGTFETVIEPFFDGSNVSLIRFSRQDGSTNRCSIKSTPQSGYGIKSEFIRLGAAVQTNIFAEKPAVVVNEEEEMLDSDDVTLPVSNEFDRNTPACLRDAPQQQTIFNNFIIPQPPQTLPPSPNSQNSQIIALQKQIEQQAEESRKQAEESKRQMEEMRAMMLKMMAQNKQ